MDVSRPQSSKSEAGAEVGTDTNPAEAGAEAAVGSIWDALKTGVPRRSSRALALSVPEQSTQLSQGNALSQGQETVLSQGAALSQATAVSRGTDTPNAPVNSGGTSEAAARLHGVLTPGSHFSVYLVDECIGEGGMARIYRAEHAGLRRQVALKVLTNGLAKDPEGRERFVREARIAAAIKHPNVVNIFDVGVHEEVPYLVMELLEGTDLETLLQAKGALEESLILDIMIPVVAGLTAVHDAGIVHRDLKPGNIFLSKGRYDDLEPKLLDFGISKASGANHLKLTTHGVLMGTPFYMSPEGLRGEEMTPLSDQYSLGVLMYECATGRAPFEAPTFPELARAIWSGKYKSPSEYNPSLSKRLVRIINRAMSLDPSDRFGDLREIGRELLLLAGQRTRITWGLSFGETKPQSSWRPTSSTPPVSHAVKTGRTKDPWKRTALVVLPLLLGFAVVKWLEQSPTSVEVAPALPAPSPSPSPKAGSGPDQEAPVSAAAAATPAGIPLPSKPSPDSQAAALPRLGSTPQVLPAPSSDDPGSTSRRRRPTARPRGGGQEEQPEWAIPSSGATQANKAVDLKTSVGANGAPIFD